MNDTDEKKPKSLSQEEIEVINKSIIDQLKAQANNPYNVIIAAGGGGAGSGGSGSGPGSGAGSSK